MDADKLYKAERARALLDDPILQNAFKVLESSLVEEMLRGDATDEQRKSCSDRINAARAVLDIVSSHVAAAQPQRVNDIKLP